MALFNVPALIGAMVVLLVMRRHPTGGRMVLTAAILLPEEALTATEWAGVGLLTLAGVAEASGDAGEETRG